MITYNPSTLAQIDLIFVSFSSEFVSRSVRAGLQASTFSAFTICVTLVDMQTHRQKQTVIHCESKKTAPIYFCNNFVKPSSILTIFGVCVLR